MSLCLRSGHALWVPDPVAFPQFDPLQNEILDARSGIRLALCGFDTSSPFIWPRLRAGPFLVLSAWHGSCPLADCAHNVASRCAFTVISVIAWHYLGMLKLRPKKQAPG